ncbi:hypothetical protein DFH09DRAFT_1096249 [Mycena vulgaris]|nr:hypothetical protein DFH09DRAFT_1096249 [Mycena vulgaris]
MSSRVGLGGRAAAADVFRPGVAKREGRASATRMGLEDTEVTGVLARTGVVGGMGGGVRRDDEEETDMKKLGASDASRFGVGDAGSVLTDGVEKGEGAGRGVPKEGATSCARSRNEVPATGVGAGSEEEPNEIGATGTPGGHDSTEERPATKNLLGLPRQKRQENSSRMGGAQGHAASDPDIHCGVVPPARRVLPRSWASLRLRHPALAHPRSHQLSPPVPRGVLHGRQTHRVYQCRPPLDAHRRGIPRASLGRHPASIHVPAPPVVHPGVEVHIISGAPEVGAAFIGVLVVVVVRHIIAGGDWHVEPALNEGGQAVLFMNAHFRTWRCWRASSSRFLGENIRAAEEDASRLEHFGAVPAVLSHTSQQKKEEAPLAVSG